MPLKEWQPCGRSARSFHGRSFPTCLPDLLIARRPVNRGKRKPIPTILISHHTSGCHIHRTDIMVSQTTVIACESGCDVSRLTCTVAVASPLTVLCLGGVVLALLRHRRYQQAQRRLSHGRGLADSFPPSSRDDEGEWSRVSLPPLPTGSQVQSTPKQNSSQTQLFIPQNTTQTVSFLRIGRPGHSDSRERLQSVASTLSLHTSQAIPGESSGYLRADRIGSVDDPALFARAGPTGSAWLEGGSVRIGSTQLITPASTRDLGSFSVHRGPRESLSVRKVSEGGMETMVPVNQAISDPPVPHPYSPPDLDDRFAKALSDGYRPPSRIDFSRPIDPLEYTPQPMMTSLKHQVSSQRADGNSLLTTSDAQKRESIEPALPSSKVCSPARPPPDTASIQFLTETQDYRTPLGPVSHSHAVNLALKEDRGYPSHGENRQTGCGSSSRHSKRSSTSRKKPRPDSIDLAMIRSPKLAAHHADHLSVPSPSPPPLTAALQDLKNGIASSVMALKSASTSTHFPYSVPSTPSPKTIVPRTPRTPRTATSEGGHSAISDIESAQLFQAWRGFRAPPTPDIESQHVRRAFSVQDRSTRRKILERSATHDGELAVEIVRSGAATPVQHQPAVRIDFSRKPVNENNALAVEPISTSLSPSPVNSRSSSPQPKITYLSEVVKEDQRRLSFVSQISVRDQT